MNELPLVSVCLMGTQTPGSEAWNRGVWGALRPLYTEAYVETSKMRCRISQWKPRSYTTQKEIGFKMAHKGQEWEGIVRSKLRGFLILNFSLWILTRTLFAFLGTTRFLWVHGSKSAEVAGGLAVALFPSAGQELGAEAHAHFTTVSPLFTKNASWG